MKSLNTPKTVLRDRTFKLVFLTVFLLCIVIGIQLALRVKSRANPDPLTYIEHWTVIDAAGNRTEAGRTFDDERAFEEDFTIISQLPDEIGYDGVLCFLNRGDVCVYINGELRKDFKRERDVGFVGGHLKDFYMVVPLRYNDAGAEVRIIRHQTEWLPVVAPETFVTSVNGLYAYLMEQYGVTFSLSVILLVASCLVFLVGLFMRIWYRQTMNMIYAALGIMDIALWLLSVSQLTPFVSGILYVDGIMGFLFCMLMPFSLLIYINEIQKGRYFIPHAVMFLLSLASLVLWTVLHFTGLRSFQDSLVFMDTVLGLAVVNVFVTLGLDIRKGHIKEYPFTAIGFAVFMALAIVEIIMLFFFELNSNELPILVGLTALLVFVVFQQVDDVRKVWSHLEAAVNQKIIENEQMLIHIVQTLAGTIDAKDNYTNGHSSRVADYAREIARRAGYDENGQDDIYMTALLHDIGKIGIPDSIINKPGKLTPEEYAIIQKHPAMGAKILQNIKEKPELSEGARWHHERYGGGGYPDGIRGEEIPERARIIAVADAYDAMTSYRSYRDPMPQEKVIEQITEGMGTQFDPRFAAIMLEMIAEDPGYTMCEIKTQGK